MSGLREMICLSYWKWSKIEKNVQKLLVKILICEKFKLAKAFFRVRKIVSETVGSGFEFFLIVNKVCIFNPFFFFRIFHQIQTEN